jgi:hypothetical protein
MSYIWYAHIVSLLVDRHEYNGKLRPKLSVCMGVHVVECVHTWIDTASTSYDWPTPHRLDITTFQVIVRSGIVSLGTIPYMYVFLLCCRTTALHSCDIYWFNCNEPSSL